MQSTPGDLHPMGCVLLWSLHLPPPSAPRVEAAVPSTRYFRFLRALHVAPCHRSSARIHLSPIETVASKANANLLNSATETQRRNASVLSCPRNESATDGLMCSWWYFRTIALTSLLFPVTTICGKCNKEQHCLGKASGAALPWLSPFLTS